MEELRFQHAVARLCAGSMEYKEPLHEIWGKNGGGALTQFLDRWHPVDPRPIPMTLLLSGLPVTTPTQVVGRKTIQLSIV